MKVSGLVAEVRERVESVRERERLHPTGGEWGGSWKPKTFLFSDRTQQQQQQQPLKQQQLGSEREKARQCLSEFNELILEFAAAAKAAAHFQTFFSLFCF